MQITLSSPEITCDHCISTIHKTVDAIDGARSIRGDWQTRQFAVDVNSGSLLDAIGVALETEGYPFGDAGLVSQAAPPLPLEAASDWQPAYSVTGTDVGADVNYACPCSCDAGFAFNRSQAEQSPEHCCCGRTMLVGRDAEERLRASLDGTQAYTVNVQTVTMPWGQPIQAALAIPVSGAEHRGHASE